MIRTYKKELDAKDQEMSEALRSNEEQQWKQKTNLEDLQANTSIGAYQKNIRDIEKLLQAAKADVRKATEEFNTKQLQLAEAQAIIQTFQSSLNTAKTDLQVKQLKLATANARFEALQTSRDALSADLEAKRRKLALVRLRSRNFETWTKMPMARSMVFEFKSKNSPRRGMA
jgi:chromosome segregation ATPase